MKELSIEEKAQRYDKAFERANAAHKDEDRHLKATLERIFPELKESEDEKIRKEILDFATKANNGVTSILANNYNFNKWLAWLEKKGEQKPANTSCLLSWTENEEKMLQYLEGIVKDYWAKAEQENNEIKIKEASDVSYFLKTIQKSPLCWIKCSDGLPNRDGTYLVVTDGRHNDIYDLARYDSVEGWHKASDIIYWMPIPQLNNKSIIEYHPAKWSEEDEEMWIDAIKYLELFDAQGIHGDVAVSCIEWLKSIKERYTWKPSDEQIKALDFAADCIVPAEFCIKRKVLKELLEQLKKLKEE